jgi:endonuclease/exonuclease/phosphatase family metal-dependent hydrolase
MQLRLMSYNIRSLRDDGDAVTRVIRDARPDVVCIQEAPRFLRWRAQAASIARRSGLLVVTGGRPAAGNLLLCAQRVEVLGSWDVLLSPEPRLHQRGAAVALMQKQGVRFAVAGTHLDLRSEPRVRHVAELDSVLSGLVEGAPGLPTIVAGDVNDLPGSPVWQAITRERRDAAAEADGEPAPTFSAASPRKRIDGVFVGPGVEVLAAEVLETPDVRVASDHRPVVVDLEIGAAAP